MTLAGARLEEVGMLRGAAEVGEHTPFMTHEHPPPVGGLSPEFKLGSGGVKCVSVIAVCLLCHEMCDCLVKLQHNAIGLTSFYLLHVPWK